MSTCIHNYYCNSVETGQHVNIFIAKNRSSTYVYVLQATAYRWHFSRYGPQLSTTSWCHYCPCARTLQIRSVPLSHNCIAHQKTTARTTGEIDIIYIDTVISKRSSKRHRQMMRQILRTAHQLRNSLASITSAIPLQWKGSSTTYFSTLKLLHVSRSSGN